MSASDADLWGEDIVEGCEAGSLIVVAAEQTHGIWDFKIKISNLWFLIETSCCKIQMNLQCTEILMNTMNTLS